MSGSTIPLVMSATGPVATSSATMLATVIANAAASAPGYTVLPGGLIDDVSGTATAALIQADQARIDAVNSVTPLGANAFILAALGQQFGIPQGQPTNTSAYVIFGGLGGGPNASGPGTPGYIIPAGTLVSDGTYQYATQDASIIGSDGFTPLVYVVAIQSGSWAVPINAISTVVSSIAAGVSFSVYNPQAGVPGGVAETVASYRARVMQAGRVAGSGTPTFVTTLLQAVAGVQARLVAIRQVSGGWEVICGGGDQYAVALAIYQGILDLSTIQGSSTTARNISVSINDVGQTYTIIFVNPPQQAATIAATWNTTQTNFTAGTTIAQLAAPALAGYINSIQVGQPINLLDATAVFQNAIASVLPANLLTTLTFVVTINGTTVDPTAGTSIIPSDPESFFYCAPAGATVTQG